MLQIPYVKIIPYPFGVVLDQYFDFEHIAHVHPTTLGEYVLVENLGSRIVYDQLWPADGKGRRATSRVVQTYQPPGDIRFEFVAGKYKGTLVLSQLRSHPDGTEVREIYHVPWLPNWGVLRRLISPAIYRQVERIWDEDLRVGLCIGGWPGTPGVGSRVDVENWRQPLQVGVYRVGPASKFAPDTLTAVDTAGGAVLIAHTPDGIRATHPICPHTGGPLNLGQMEKGCLVCPWHGARFDIGTGKAITGPTRIPLPVYGVRIEDGEVVVEASGGATTSPMAPSER